MSKTVLIILGLLILLVGILNLFSTTLLGGLSNSWSGIIKIVIGLVAVLVAASDKAK